MSKLSISALETANHRVRSTSTIWLNHFSQATSTIRHTQMPWRVAKFSVMTKTLAHASWPKERRQCSWTAVTNKRLTFSAQSSQREIKKLPSAKIWSSLCTTTSWRRTRASSLSTSSRISTSNQRSFRSDWSPRPTPFRLCRRLCRRMTMRALTMLSIFTWSCVRSKTWLVTSTSSRIGMLQTHPLS